MMTEIKMEGDGMEHRSRRFQEVHEILDTELYLAGDRVAPGCYCEIDTNAKVHLEREDTLPASLDGRVACYVRLHSRQE